MLATERNGVLTGALRCSSAICTITSYWASAVWFMEERAPDLTQHMLNELSESPTPVTKD